MSKSNRPPNRKRKVLLFILIALILLNVYYKSPLTYVKEKKIINYAMLRHRIDFVLESIQIDAGNKKISYKLYTRFYAEPEQFGKIRCRFNEYLKKHPDYFINDGYIIELQFVGNPSGGPIVIKFSNRYNDEKFNELGSFDKLDCLELTSFANYMEFNLYEIKDFAMFQDIKALMLEEDFKVKDISIFDNFKSLEYFRYKGKLSDEQKEELKNILPDDCLIDI